MTIVLFVSSHLGSAALWTHFGFFLTVKRRERRFSGFANLLSLGQICLFLAMLSFPIQQVHPQDAPSSPAEEKKGCGCEGDERPDFFSPAEEGIHPDSASTSESGKLRLDLFVMSLCPYGMEAESALIPLVARFPDRIDFHLYFIADEKSAEDRASKEKDRAPARRLSRSGCASGSGSGEGPFRSLHGQEEIDEDRRQLVVQAEYPDRFLPYLLCRSRQGPDGDWRICAQAVGIDVDALRQKALGPRGTHLLRENIRKGLELHIDLSPTLLIDGREYTGSLRPFPLARHLCGRMPDDEFCRSIPVCGSDEDCTPPPGQQAICENPDTPKARCRSYQPVSFTLTVIEDPDCRACASQAFLRTTRELFPGVQVQRIEKGTPEGDSLSQVFSVGVFPAYIFGPAFVQSPRFSRVEHMLRRTKEGFVVLPRISSISQWRQRPPIPGRLDLFLPVGRPEEAEEFLRPWPGAQVRFHYLLGEGDLGRPPEEFVRRGCLLVEQPDHYLEYLRRRGTRPVWDSTGWEDDLRKSGADLEQLRTCVHERGVRLLAESRALADSLDLSPSSPAALLENQLLVRRARADQVAGIWQERKKP